MREIISFRGWPTLCVVGGAVLFAGCQKSGPPSLGSSMVGALSAGDAGSIEDLDGRAAEPMPNERAVAYVFIFTRSDCPISNRYAPEYRRLWEKFHGQGVVFRLVYPDAGDTAKAVRDNLTAFDLPLEAVRDPHHALVHRCGIHTTPEAAVFLGDRQSMVYRGRIDDRFVDFGVARREATTHDLEQAIQTAIDHKSNGLVTTRAVGCTIADAP